MRTLREVLVALLLHALGSHAGFLRLCPRWAQRASPERAVRRGCRGQGLAFFRNAVKKGVRDI